MRLKNLYGEQVYYFFSDHLGSTNVMTDTNGNIVTEMMYKAWGEVRYSSGSSPTDFTYTGQRSEMDNIGLMFYNARWYDPELGRFAQADNIIPAKKVSVSWDRYAYVRNNPISFNDPSGHDVGCAGRDASECSSVVYNPDMGSGNDSSNISDNDGYQIVESAVDFSERMIKEIIIQGVKLEVPVLLPIELGSYFNISSTTLSTSSKVLSRFGKSLGLLGWGLQVAPEQIENIKQYDGFSNVPANETWADLMIDTGIWGGGQFVGLFAGGVFASTTNPFIIAGAGTAASMAVSAGLEYVVDSNDLRSQFSNYLYESSTKPLIFPSWYQSWYKLNINQLPAIGP